MTCLEEKRMAKIFNVAFQVCGDDKWLPVKESNTYTFRGPINITHLVNDCIRDGKQAFIAISDEVVVGISKQFVNIPRYMRPCFLITSPFYLYQIDKKDIPTTVKLLKDIDKQIKKEIRKIAKQIAKDKRNGKFSNAPETKVLTF